MPTTSMLKIYPFTPERWADFDAGIGIVKQRPDVARAFDFTLAG